MLLKKSALAIAVAAVISGCGSSSSDNDPVAETENSPIFFNRLATLPVCTQINPTCDTDDETAAEIVSASADGNTLVYTDSPQNQLGFIDITNADAPIADGVLALTGEPTSVAVVNKTGGEYALVGVNTSADFITVSGNLSVVDMVTRTIVTTVDLGGQPDSVAISPDGTYAVIAIENERDEDLGDGEPPQLPAGYLSIVELTGDPSTWTATKIDLVGLADLFPTDPEPEYVAINDDNIAVITLQENNHIVLVDLSDGSIVNHFSAGTVDLEQVDTEEEEPAVISLTGQLTAVPREPDGVAWINTDYFATADEGDLNGGSRGFTIFNTLGEVVFAPGNSLDHLTVEFGHYPDGRSGNKGNEPENITVATYDGTPYLFVNSERSSIVFVYDVSDPTTPVYKQTLPAASGPEGSLAITDRDLFVVASEVDDRGDKLRSTISIYQRESETNHYPSISSVNRLDQTPIPWSALSGLAADANDANTLFAVDDSFYASNRIFTIDTSKTPAEINSEMTISDSNNVLAAIDAVALADTTVDDDDASRVGVFDEADRAALINTDLSINIDPEGISLASDGGFWIASEGAGTIGDTDHPINSLNMLIKTSVNGVIESVATLPTALNDVQLRFGFEGVAEYDGRAYVAFQRAWNNEANPRIGIFNPADDSWSFLFYPLGAAASQNGGWVGLSDIVSLGEGRFRVIERDNQGGPDAAIKRLYDFDVSGVAENGTVTKTLVRDLLSEGDLSVNGGLVFEKIEGLSITADGNTYIVNDNDGVDANSGETQLIDLGEL